MKILLGILVAAVLLAIAIAGCYIAMVIMSHLLYKHFGEGGKDEDKN